MELMAPEGWNRSETFSMATTLKAQDLGVRLPSSALTFGNAKH